MVSAGQSTRGNTLNSNLGFISMVSDTSSQSLGCSGKEVVVLLQALTAQVRKLRVRTFIVVSAKYLELCCGGTPSREYFEMVGLVEKIKTSPPRLTRGSKRNVC